MIGGIDAAQVQVILHAFAQGREGLGIQIGQHEQCRPGIEGIAVHGHAAAAPAGFFTFFQHSHPAALPR